MNIQKRKGSKESLIKESHQLIKEQTLCRGRHQIERVRMTITENIRF